MTPKLRQLQDYFEGTADPETAARIEAELDDPTSELRQFFEDGQRRAQEHDIYEMARAMLEVDELEDASDSENDGVIGLDHTVDLTQTSLRRRRVEQLVTIAASLLVGVFLGSLVFRGGSAGPEILVAQASIGYETPRGGSPQPTVRVQPPIDGFVTLITLAPDRRPLVIPPLGGDYIRVSRNNRSDGISVPEDTTTVLSVVTPTPSADPIEREFSGRNAKRYAPEDASELRSDLETFLLDFGYRRIAIGVSEVPLRDTE